IIIIGAILFIYIKTAAAWSEEGNGRMAVVISPQEYKKHKRQRDFRLKQRPRFKVPKGPTRKAAPRGVSLAGLNPVLAAKAQELQRVCGSVVISGVAHRRVAGSRRLSMHA